MKSLLLGKMVLPLGLPNPLFYFLLSSQLANEFRESIQKIPLAYDSKSESLRCCKGKRQPEAEEIILYFQKKYYFAKL